MFMGLQMPEWTNYMRLDALEALPKGFAFPGRHYSPRQLNPSEFI